jgi:hypothetical protein
MALAGRMLFKIAVYFHFKTVVSRRESRVRNVNIFTFVVKFYQNNVLK